MVVVSHLCLKHQITLKILDVLILQLDIAFTWLQGYFGHESTDNEGVEWISKLESKSFLG